MKKKSWLVLFFVMSSFIFMPLSMKGAAAAFKGSEAAGAGIPAALAAGGVSSLREQPFLALPPPLRQPLAPTACSSLPRSENIRGKLVDLNLCYEYTFAHAGTNYTIDVYYTETDTAANEARCGATDYAGRCEHAIAANPDGSGHNTTIVTMAQEAERAISFYKDRNMTNLAGGTLLNIFVAEDPRIGGTPYCNAINVDDDYIDNTDTLRKRVLAFHEMQHLLQCYNQPTPGWDDFYGEGIARAIEDRVDTGLDADTGHLFIPEINGILGEDVTRSMDFSLINYRSALWWTWLFDQYRAVSDVNPVIGWQAIKDFYSNLNAKPNTLTGLRNFITSRGGVFRQDFTDYTLAMYAYKYTNAAGFARIDFLDTEINSSTTGLTGHTVIAGGPPFSSSTVAMSPRSSRYWEYAPASQCEFIGFSFDGGAKPYSFSAMTVDNVGNLQKRWTSYSKTWARTVRTSGLSRLVGVISAIDDSGSVTLGQGCVTPSLVIKRPTFATFEMVGNADNPRNFLVRLKVTGAGGAAVAGLTAGDFTVQIQKSTGGAWIAATTLDSTYVMDDYWLLIRSPTTADGAQTGLFHHLKVSLGSASATQNNSILYMENNQDVMVVLDRSGSMGPPSGKIEAARNAAALLVNELADTDRGGYVAFDTTAILRKVLDFLSSGPGSHRQDLENSITDETVGNMTSIGDGMKTAWNEYHPKKDATRGCSFVLLSDGYENTDPMWADVRTDVVGEGCPIHTIALGPQANETLLQQIAAEVPGGTYDYADQTGSVPLGPAGVGGVGPTAITADISWQNNLSRVYDFKASQIAGRQRIQAVETNGEKNQFMEYSFFVDETARQVLLAIAWQYPTGEYDIRLFDPFGDEAIPTITLAPRAPGGTFDSLFRRLSPQYTNEVWELNGPMPGYWKLQITNLYQQYMLSLTTQSLYQLHLFIGVPLEQAWIGSVVPIQAMFTGPEKPILGAEVNAKIRAPSGVVHMLHLFDDGSHGDGEEDDGVYGNFFSATSSGDGGVSSPPSENEAPAVIGSYQVNVTAVSGDILREAQGSFALDPAEDTNQNRIPDSWERLYRITNPDPNDDPDGDKLVNFCEWLSGTDPWNSDTDGGGQSDGSEVQNCVAVPTVQDPLNPADDRVRRLGSFSARRLLNLQLRGYPPFNDLIWGDPESGNLLSVDIYRMTFTPTIGTSGDWQLLVGGFNQGNEFADSDVDTLHEYKYRLMPTIGYGTGLAPLAVAEGAVEETDWVAPSSDPYPPSGSIMINDGAQIVWNPLVKLSFTADDTAGGSDGDNQIVPSSPVGALQLRVSLTPDFAEAVWMPFTTEILNWDLGTHQPGSMVTVYVQFKDEAGNVSEGGMALSASVVFRPPLYLPMISRQ